MATEISFVNSIA